MEKHWAPILIGIGVEIIVTIFGVVVKAMSMPLVICFGVIGLVLIVYGLVSLIRSKGKDGGNIYQISGDLVQNFYLGSITAKEEEKVSESKSSRARSKRKLDKN